MASCSILSLNLRQYNRQLFNTELLRASQRVTQIIENPNYVLSNWKPVLNIILKLTLTQISMFYY